MKNYLYHHTALRIAGTVLINLVVLAAFFFAFTLGRNLIIAGYFAAAVIYMVKNKAKHVFLYLMIFFILWISNNTNLGIYYSLNEYRLSILWDSYNAAVQKILSTVDAEDREKVVIDNDRYGLLAERNIECTYNDEGVMIEFITGSLDDVAGIVYYSDENLITMMKNEYNMVDTYHSEDKFWGYWAVFSRYPLKATEQIEVEKAFERYSKNENDSDIYAQGKSGGIVTVNEVDMATDFYIKAGNTDTEAREKAIDYLLEREALYQKAITSGFTASEEEIRDYINELKNLVQTAENREDMQLLINEFDTEEEYWEFEYEVYRKKLPILKYLESVKQEYYSSEGKIAPDSNESTNTINGYSNYLESVKEQLVKEEFGVTN
mgnify:CR=1 FL=1